MVVVSYLVAVVSRLILKNFPSVLFSVMAYFVLLNGVKHLVINQRVVNEKRDVELCSKCPLSFPLKKYRRFFSKERALNKVSFFPYLCRINLWCFYASKV